MIFIFSTTLCACDVGRRSRLGVISRYVFKGVSNE